MPLALYKRKRNELRPTEADEDKLSSIGFKVYKFNKRRKPRQLDRTLILSCFSEFGCETLGCLYQIPRMMSRFPGRYVIAMGWYGREYLYRHLVDEFWEIDEQYMWLRNHTYAFHHSSSNLTRLEEAASEFGMVIPSVVLGKYAVGNMCKTCGYYWHDWRKKTPTCEQCGSTFVYNSMFSDLAETKKRAVLPPKPSSEMMEWAKKLIKPRTVGLFARGRKTYGRNLEPSFYVELIKLLEQRGYNVIWLGEKQSTQPCPVDHVIDFSRMPESQELERTLAIICNCEFTLQFWTASTRLAGMMGTPFLLFESPEQVYCTGPHPAQEGKRLELTSFGPKKLVISHYVNCVNDPEGTLGLVGRAIDEMKVGDYSDIIGLVEEHDVVQHLQNTNRQLEAANGNA